MQSVEVIEDKMIQSRRNKIAILLLLLVIITIQVIKDRHFSTQLTANTPPKEYDLKGYVPGNPEEAISDFQRLYRLVKVYRKLNNGAYPKWSIDLYNGVLANRKAYNISSTKDLDDIFYNPDYRYSDTYQNNPPPNIENTILYQITDLRPNGSTVTGESGHDIIAWTDIYVHKNIRHFPDHDVSNPTGFYVVLWNDGRVEKIPYDQRLYAPRDNNWQLAFSGQEGLPAGTLTYDEFYVKIMGWKTAPHGAINKPGIGYDGKI